MGGWDEGSSRTRLTPTRETHREQPPSVSPAPSPSLAPTRGLGAVGAQGGRHKVTTCGCTRAGRSAHGGAVQRAESVHRRRAAPPARPGAQATPTQGRCARVCSSRGGRSGFKRGRDCVRQFCRGLCLVGCRGAELLEARRGSRGKCGRGAERPREARAALRRVRRSPGVGRRSLRRLRRGDRGRPGPALAAASAAT